ncbi:hypothetical protein LJK88_34430 [Paenibacillus sp. P26]|nr:hypothetical protein LJK88_34430 [Paenibacillus sp. P26]
MSANLSSRAQVQAAAKPKRKKTAVKKRKKRSSFGVTLFFYTVFVLFIFGIFFSGWFFLTDSGSNLRFMMADTLITTQHRDWAKYLIGSEELEKRVNRYWAQFDQYAEIKDKTLSTQPVTAKPIVQKPLVEVEPISGSNFKGYLLIVNDPKALRIAVPGKAGKGEKVSSMVQRLGAVAGVNAGGFVDPEWKGNGFQPTGLVMSGGKIFYNDGGMNTPQPYRRDR